MKAGDATAVAALRSLISAIDNAEAVPTSPSDRKRPGPSRIASAKLGVGVGDVPRRDLSEDEIQHIVRAEIADRLAAAGDYEARNRIDRSMRLRAEATVLQRILADQIAP